MSVCTCMSVMSMCGYVCVSVHVPACVNFYVCECACEYVSVNMCVRACVSVYVCEYAS